MKRKVISLLLVLMLCLSLVISVSAADLEGGLQTQIVDEAELLRRSEYNSLADELYEISRKYETQIFIVTIDSLDGVDIDDYVEYLYDSTGMGYGKRHDGILLLVCMDPREYRILSNGLANEAIGPGEIDAIGDAIKPYLSDGDYADAFETFLDECEYYLDGYLNGYPFNFGKSLLICLVIGILVGLIVVLVLRGQLKTVRRQNQANVYVRPGSMQLTVCNDLFLYRNVTRTKRDTGGNSSGGRSSRSVGGGSF